MIGASSSECCESRIKDFLEGTLDESATDQFEQHLSECDSCVEVLQQLTADGEFWTDTSGFLSDFNLQEKTITQWDDNPARQHNQLGFLDPTDDPHMLGRFAGYEICGLVGCGGMGIVLKGRDLSLDRIIAIKVLNPSYAGQSAARQRFAREAQAAAAVVHDNVIAIHGVSEWNELPFLVMPYIKGESLQQRIDRAAPLNWEGLLQVSIQIARGLAAAHDQGLIHRDIKPANILTLESVSRVIITDFGLARTADDANLTRSGVLAGTPQYMSPEQVKSEHLDGRSDLFSLGSLMYAMACGRPPFRSETPYGVMRQITDTPHVPLSVIRNDTPVWLDAIVQQLLSKNAADRFPSASALADRLEECLSHLRHPTTTLLPAISVPASSRVTNRSRSLIKLASIAVLAVVVTILVVFSSLDENDKHQLKDAAQLTERRAETSTNSDSETLQQYSPTTIVVDRRHLRWDYDETSLDKLELELMQLQEELREPQTLIDPNLSKPKTTP